MMLFSAKSAG